MYPLYQAHFGLNRAPFNITPDPTFLYLSSSHREALAQLSYGIKARKGFVVLTGEVGTGKTTLIHSLLAELHSDTETALIFNAVQSPGDLLRYACEEFHLVEPREPLKGYHDYVTMLQRFLLDSYRANKNCALIIDEAQNLSAEVLESIRLLSNFETSSDKLLQILLAGQPELSLRLNSPELRQFKQRVVLRHHLRSLNFEDCSEYICQRLQTAGGKNSTFTQQALRTIYRYSEGIPRLINIICDNAMVTAYAVGRKQIDTAIIQEVSADLCLTPVGESPLISRNLHVSRQPHAAVNVRPHERSSANNNAPPGVRPAISPTLAPRINTTLKVLPKTFLTRLATELTEAMGPMGPIILREQVSTLGENPEAFPATRLTELLDALSKDILNEALKTRFQKSIEAKLETLANE